MDMFAGELSFTTPQTLLKGPFLTILAIDMPYYRRVFSGSKIGGLPTRLKTLSKKSVLTQNSPVCKNSLERIQVLCLCSFACLMQQGHQNIVFYWFEKLTRSEFSEEVSHPILVSYFYNFIGAQAFISFVPTLQWFN